MYIQKVISRKTFILNKFIVGVLKVNDKNSRIRIHSSEAWIHDRDTDPHRNVIDLEHCFQEYFSGGKKSVFATKVGESPID
jgi:hypothetical protein